MRGDVLLKLLEYVVDSSPTIAVLLAEQLEPWEKELDVLGVELREARRA